MRLQDGSCYTVGEYLVGFFLPKKNMTPVDLKELNSAKEKMFTLILKHIFLHFLACPPETY